MYDIFSAREDVTINRCYKPYNWFPHITLGKKLEKELMVANWDIDAAEKGGYERKRKNEQENFQ